MVFYNNLDSIDLHGENRESAKILVNEFINDELKQKKYEFVIVHGIGKGIVRKSVHEALRKNKKVKEFKLDNFNIGCTVVYLKEGEL